MVGDVLEAWSHVGAMALSMALSQENVAFFRILSAIDKICFDLMICCPFLQLVHKCRQSINQATQKFIQKALTWR